MTADANRQLVRAALQRVFGQHNRSAVDEYFAPSLAPAVRTHYDELIRGFPDLTVSVNEILADGDYVAARLTLRGTHRGPFAGVAATERAMTWGSMRFYRIENDMVAETWAIQDRLGLFQQLGLVQADIGGVSWAASPPRRE